MVKSDKRAGRGGSRADDEAEKGREERVESGLEESRKRVGERAADGTGAVPLLFYFFFDLK